jgi:hypothetical protein
MNRNLLNIGMLALAAASQASALTLTFDDRGNWTSQVTSLVNFDGGPQTVGTASPFNTFAGLAATDLQIIGFNITSGTSYDLTRANANGTQPWFQWDSGTILRTGDKTAGNTVFARLVFPNPVSAFGFNFGSSGGGNSSVTIAASGLDPLNVTTLAGNNFAFWGVASDTQTFTTVDIFINDSNRYLVLDDIAQGTYNVAPPPPGPEDVAEPGTILQLAMGGMLLALARRRFGSNEGHAA